jgi:hypothetical protein
MAPIKTSISRAIAIVAIRGLDAQTASGLLVNVKHILSKSTPFTSEDSKKSALALAEQWRSNGQSISAHLYKRRRIGSTGPPCAKRRVHRDIKRVEEVIPPTEISEMIKAAVQDNNVWKLDMSKIPTSLPIIGTELSNAWYKLKGFRATKLQQITWYFEVVCDAAGPHSILFFSEAGGDEKAQYRILLTSKPTTVPETVTLHGLTTRIVDLQPRNLQQRNIKTFGLTKEEQDSQSLHSQVAPLKPIVSAELNELEAEKLRWVILSTPSQFRDNKDEIRKFTSEQFGVGVSSRIHLECEDGNYGITQLYHRQLDKAQPETLRGKFEKVLEKIEGVFLHPNQTSPANCVDFLYIKALKQSEKNPFQATRGGQDKVISSVLEKKRPVNPQDVQTEEAPDALVHRVQIPQGKVAVYYAPEHGGTKWQLGVFCAASFGPDEHKYGCELSLSRKEHIPDEAEAMTFEKMSVFMIMELKEETQKIRTARQRMYFLPRLNVLMSEAFVMQIVPGGEGSILDAISRARQQAGVSAEYKKSTFAKFNEETKKLLLKIAKMSSPSGFKLIDQLGEDDVILSLQ